MAERNRPTEGQFSLRLMFLAVTTIAIAFGVLATDLPKDLRLAVVICVPAFWISAGALRIEAGIAHSRSGFVRSLGVVVTTIVIALASTAFLGGLFTGLQFVIRLAFGFAP